MIHDYYAVFDKATKSFKQPFTARTEGDAIRMMRLAMQKNPVLVMTADDLTLMAIGGFDDSSGELISATPTVVTSFSAVAATLPSTKEENHE